jgi:hypothetical protein
VLTHKGLQSLLQVLHLVAESKFHCIFPGCNPGEEDARLYKI